MIHTCIECGTPRDCGCGDCGEGLMETCTKCNNNTVLPFAQLYNIPLKQLGLDCLGGYHLKPEHQELWFEYVKTKKDKSK